MADAIVSAVFQQLLVIIDREIQQEVRLVVGVKKEVQTLTSTLQTIRAVLVDAERRQVKEEAVKVWLDKLREISYDMTDVLDDWNTAIIKSQFEEFQNVHVQKKVFFPSILSPCFCFNQVRLRHDIAENIKDLNEKLNAIAREKDMYNFDLIRASEEPERFHTTSFVDVSEVRGREEDKSNIVSLFLGENSQEQQRGLCIISIVGMGGIGKTTLAQLAYNDPRVIAHFEERMWVCVSDPFDEIRIAKAVLEAVKGSAPPVVEFETLMRRVHEAIEGKKFLLVLDDVWNEDYRKWELLKHFLKCGARGSRILVTTRKERVADLIGTTHTIMLGELSEEDCWSLFSQVAFFGRGNEDCERFEGIGRQIAAKCKGLPLAAKTLGSLMHFKKTRQEWRNVLDSEIWEIEEAEKGLFPPLLLSYYDLPSSMRQCFSFCAVFPKDHMIKKDELIKLWLAQGYLSSKQSEEMEITGHDYFESLAARSFFQDFERDDDGSITECKMHDIVHDFARFLMKDECFSVEFNRIEDLRTNLRCRLARHLTLRLPEVSPFPPPFHDTKKLHTLLYMSRSKVDGNVSASIHHLSYLRALHLNYSTMEEVPRELGNLIHLRYLNLSDNYHLEKLPETLCDLCHLQTLKLNWCERLRELPQGMWKLINLRHLEISGTIGLTTLPKGVGRLCSLRTLSKFIVSGGDSSQACKIGDLKNLQNLEGHLEIEGLGNVADANEAENAELKNKKHLLGLNLHFSGGGTEGRIDGDVLEAFQPPPDLEYLEIIDYRGTTLFPSWMISLSELRTLGLINCKKCELLPPLGKLPFLESLQIMQMDSVKNVGLEFLGDNINNGEPVIAFPKLKKLYFHSMINLEEWDVPTGRGDGTKLMPRLCYLEIEYCTKMKALPHHLQNVPLEQLTIRGCPILEQRCQDGREDWAKISHVPNIQISDQ